MEAKYTLLYTWQIKEKPLKKYILKMYYIENKLKNIINTIIIFCIIYFLQNIIFQNVM